MASTSAFKFLSQLPAPKNKSVYDASSDAWFANRDRDPDAAVGGAAAGGKIVPKRQIPPYGKRQGFVPRRVEDFGDGGAFPEIHVAQYPLEMGRKQEKVTNKVLPVTVDGEGNIAYDAIVKLGENSQKVVYSQHKDLIPKIQDEDLEALRDEEDEDEMKETAERTKAAIDKIVTARLSAAQPKNVPGISKTPQYIKYTPGMQNSAHNSGAKERVIRMVEMPVDPLDPPKFKHKRVPKASGSPPVPVMHSPPRPVTVKDQQDWKIPPCISNWKNPKGYTIPLDKRLAADGRGLQEVQINDNFARLSESLYVAENKAREEVEMRSKIQRERMLLEKEKKEQELRLLAQKARMERAGGGTGGGGGGGAGGGALASREAAAGGADGGYGRAEGDEPRRGETREEREERMRREALREERRRERERERRLEAKEGAGGKKSKLTRDRDRDISEKMALGLANVGGAGGGGEIMYDQRLFNQEQGMESGFAADDTYNIYDKGLFNREGASGLYKVRKGVDEEVYAGRGGGEEGGGADALLRTERFKPDKGFAGAAERGAGGGGGAPRDGPVEFERDAAVEADPFGLDQFLTQVKTGKKALDKVGAGGTMRASGGGGSYEAYEGGSSRNRVDFERGSCPQAAISSSPQLCRT
ncbi:unnamed protein product [Closterium sp. NIES-65]|nr:unnamed protein product [Closterium sp. NIES-65]CAI6011538.1 unnamed protein product [Closterium sp. NIES-65]